MLPLNYIGSLHNLMPLMVFCWIGGASILMVSIVISVLVFTGREATLPGKTSLFCQDKYRRCAKPPTCRELFILAANPSSGILMAGATACNRITTNILL